MRRSCLVNSVALCDCPGYQARERAQRGPATCPRLHSPGRTDRGPALHSQDPDQGGEEGPPAACNGALGLGAGRSSRSVLGQRGRLGVGGQQGTAAGADRGSLKQRETLDPPRRRLTRAPNLPSAAHLFLPAACHTAWDDRGDTRDARVKHPSVRVTCSLVCTRAHLRVLPEDRTHHTRAGAVCYVHGAPRCCNHQCFQRGRLPPAGSPPGASLKCGVSSSPLDSEFLCLLIASGLMRFKAQLPSCPAALPGPPHPQRNLGRSRGVPCAHTDPH